MNKIEIKVGDYVFASKYSDGSPKDPWFVSVVTYIEKENGRVIYKVDGSSRLWNHAKKISKNKGEKILKEYPIKEIYG